MVRRAFIVSLLGLWPLACASAPRSAPTPPIRQVYVVRHAEKVTQPRQEDPPLTGVGARRAEALPETVPLDSIVAVYSTDTSRTRATVAPVAERVGLPVETYGARDFASLREAIDQLPPGAVLVAGHSNTIPGMLAHFGIAGPQTIPDDRYGDLWVVTLHPDGGATLQTEHFGP